MIALDSRRKNRTPANDVSMEQCQRRNVIIDTYQAALEEGFEDHKAEATRKSEIRMKAETANAKLSMNQALAKTQLEIKRRQSKVQQELKDKIFEEAGKH